MDVVDSLEEMFQWQTPPFCYTPLNFLMGFEVANIPSLDAMLVDIELPEINMIVSASSYSEPVQSILPLSPSNTITTTTPVVNSAIEEASVSIRDPTKLIDSSVQKGTRAFEILAASDTPPVVKPKGSRRSSRPTTKAEGVVPKAKKEDPASTFKLGAAEVNSKGKETRVPTKAEHIIRERQRRDDMAAKYATLESLLPPASKRERAAVVEDAISFVEALQQKKTQLQMKSADLKLKASCNNQSPSWGKKTRSSAHLPQSLGTVDNPSPCIPKKQRSSASSNGINPILDQAAIGPHTASAISDINVHLGEGEIVVETVWRRPRSNFQSALLMAVESLGFEVTKCCILRVGNGYMQCVITCTKLQGLSLRKSEVQSSSTTISKALRHMLTLAD